MISASRVTSSIRSGFDSSGNSPSAADTKASGAPGSSALELPPEVRRAAIDEVRSLLPSAESLSRLSQIRAQLKRSLQEKDDKLRSVVQSQVDETQWAQQLLAQSTSTIDEVKTKIGSILSLCQQCDHLLQEYPHIRRIAVARRNLRATVSMLELFRSIPERAEALRSLIVNDDHQIKEVYLQMRQLVQLRDKAMEKGLQLSGDMKEELMSRFEILQKVLSLLADRVFENITLCMVLAEEDSLTLIRTLEVVEIEDHAETFYLFESISNQSGSHARSNAGKHESMMERSLKVLEESIGKRFAEAFEDKITDEASQDRRSSEPTGDDMSTQSPHTSTRKRENVLGQILKKGRELIEDLQFVAENLVPLFPPRWQIFTFYETRYQKWLYARLLDTTSDVSTLSPVDLLECIRWIQDYGRAMEGLNADLSASSQLMQLSPMLMEAYMDRVKSTMSDWVTKIVQTDWRSEPEQDEREHYYTNAPQDVFTMLNQQLDVAEKRGLVDKPYFDVAVSCGQVLQEYQQSLISALKAQGLEKSEAYLCAILNNCQSCSDNAESLRDRCLEHLHDALADELTDAFEETLAGFVQLGSACVGVMVEQIIQCIREKLIPRLFTRDWATGPNGECAGDIVATLQDFNGDYESWISSDFFFQRLVKESLSKTFTAYTDALIKSGMDVADERYSRQLDEDFAVLKEYVESKAVKDFVSQRDIDKILQSFNTLRNLLTCEPGFMNLSFELLFETYGKDGERALKDVLGLRSDLSWAEKNNVIERYRERYTDVEAVQSPLNQATTSQKGKEASRARNVLNNFWVSIRQRKGDE